MTTDRIIFTRKQYLAKECTHEQFYEGVTHGMRIHFNRQVSPQMLKDDPHLNRIPLQYWDSLALAMQMTLRRRLKECGDYFSLAGGVCAVKHIAKRQAQIAQTETE